MNDASPVITNKIEFRPFDHPDFRWGKKVQVLTLGNIATYATVTPKNIGDFKGWFPVPKIPKSMREQQ
jgi:hypothetical protein